MPRELSDVIDYFLPAAQSPRDPGPECPSALPILTLAVGGGDALRAAFAWNLSVELARLGARALLVAPDDPACAALWPAPGRGPVGAEVEAVAAPDLAALADAAAERAARGAADAPEGGVVVVCAPPRWLLAQPPAPALLRWLLLFARPERRDLEEAYALAKRAYARGADPLVGLTIHGAAGFGDARRAYGRVARAAARHLGRAPTSYGLLADDLHVYRAVASRRPIGLEHPQSRAARALGDVARMLWDDAGKRCVA